MSFRKKPIVIEAIQYTGENCFDVLRFMGRQNEIWECDLLQTDAPVINTLEGNLYTSSGDWIIKGVNGEFYPCKPDIFEATYEPVTD